MSKPEPKYAWATPGEDPTEMDFPLERQTVSGCLGKVFNWMVWVMAFVGLVSLYLSTRRPDTPPADILPTPLIEIAPTESIPAPIPGTSMPTPLPSPTPTETPIPPGAIATWTPGPWMLTRWASTYEAVYGTPTTPHTEIP